MLLPGSALAAPSAPPFEVGGWIPYWRASAGTIDALSHLPHFTALFPFGYIVQNDGALHDAFGLDAPMSTTSAALLAGAKAAGMYAVQSRASSTAFPPIDGADLVLDTLEHFERVQPTAAHKPGCPFEQPFEPRQVHRVGRNRQGAQPLFDRLRQPR